MKTGVTVLPEFFQNEGVESVVERLAAAKVDMIATSPYVMEPSDEKNGSREPPVDAGAGSAPRVSNVPPIIVMSEAIVLPLMKPRRSTSERCDSVFIRQKLRQSP